jgi:DnaJ family protein A protein 2
MGSRAKGAARAALQYAAAPSLRQPPLRREPLVLAKRCLASGPNFGGFPFGGGFPGGGAPPSGDSEKYYKLLDVSKQATDKEIKQAYKKLAMKHHPDRGGDEDTFKSISKAYEVLTNPEKRQIYDQYGEEGLENMEQGSGGPGPGTDPFDLFSQIFGFNAGGRSQRGRPVTPDSTYELQLSLEELYTGTSRNIVFTRDALCGTCNGEGGQDRKQCSRCGGTGRQIHMQQMGLFVQQVQTVCSACDGKGHIIPPGKTCKDCKGKCTVKEKKHLQR